MEVTQSFRLAGETDIIEIPCEQVDGQHVVQWEDIELAFPRARYVKRGNILVTLMKNLSQTRSIKHYPDVVLDVVLSTSDKVELTNVCRISNSTGAVLQQQDLPFDDKNDTQSTLALNEVVELAQTNVIETDAEQLLVASPPSYFQSMILTSNTPDALVQAIKDGHLNRLGEQLIVCLQDFKEVIAKNNELASKNNELTTQVIKLQEAFDAKQDELKQLRIHAPGQLALLQNSIKALMTRTYELHEHPTPRLFIVLPDHKSSWNPSNFFSNKFRLYFLCECGEHTKAIDSKIPHHIHLAKHEGYHIDRPNEFFQQYGSYVLTILRMLKFGISVAGITVPVLSQLIRADGIDQATTGLNLPTKTIEFGMDQVIDHIDKTSADRGGELVSFAEQMEGNEALEVADLRQLESFLCNKDWNRVLGNLYRIVTTEGHVKWVCIDHFREIYHAKAAQSFRDTVDSLQESFHENIGRVEVVLRSKAQAEQFYTALESANSVYELKVVFEWETTQGDLKKLRNTLALTNVGVLEFHLSHQDGPTRDILNRNYRCDPLLDIMRHRFIQSVTIRGLQDFFKRSSPLSRNDDFSNLRHLDIPLQLLEEDIHGVILLIAKTRNLSRLVIGPNAGNAQASLGETVGDLVFPPTLRHLEIPLYQLKDDIPSIKLLISNASNLSSLTLRTGPNGDNSYAQQAYNAIAEHQTYPIIFKEWGISIPPPPRESDQSMEWVEHIFRFYRNGSIEELVVDNLDESTLDALAKVTYSDSGLKELYLRRDGQLGDPFINNISGIVDRCGLHQIRFFTYEDKGRVRILESIQWKHLRNLSIHLTAGTFESVMRALVDGVNKMSGKVELDTFTILSEADDGTFLTLPGGDLLEAFLASTLIKRLELYVDMALERIFSLLKTADFSQLEHFELWAKGFDSFQVDAILDGLYYTKKLRRLHLIDASITSRQAIRMWGRKIAFSNCPIDFQTR
ncbi:hypothetical protein BGX34_011389 [Mortierella sp. NVP85]|nr:hypothetical protein BGX34_011389 [Mortierella sp. NVP85]